MKYKPNLAKLNLKIIIKVYYIVFTVYNDKKISFRNRDVVHYVFHTS